MRACRAVSVFIKDALAKSASNIYVAEKSHKTIGLTQEGNFSPTLLGACEVDTSECPKA